MSARDFTPDRAGRPLVLAGPIVRRTTPHRVTVWLVASERLDPAPHLTLYDSGSAVPIASEPEWHPVWLGRQLVAYLLVAKPKQSLATGKVYEYDILLGGARPLFDQSELRQIVLRGRSRPSFVLGARTGSEIRAMYGSCRKLHGPG